MYFKKAYIFYILITFLNVILFYKSVTISKDDSIYCLLSDIHSPPPLSATNDNYFKNMKNLLQNEVVDLEKQRAALIKEILLKNIEFTKLHNEVHQYSIKSFRIRNSIISLTQIRKDFQRRHKSIVDFKPIISKFTKVTTAIDYHTFTKPNSNFIDLATCSVFSCFNYQNCAFNRSNTLTFSLDSSHRSLSDSLSESVRNSVFYSQSNPCVNIVLNATESTINRCHNLNCVILSMDHIVSPQKSIIANFYFTKSNYRHNFDIVMPAPLSYVHHTSNAKLPMIFPLKRRYLLSFTTSASLSSLPTLDRFVLRYLQNISDEIQKETGNNNFYFDTNCAIVKSQQHANISDWSLCEDTDSRLKRLVKSTFCLVLSHWNIDVLTTAVSQQRVFECILTGSVPVILGDLLLPFEEIIDWPRAVLRFPKQRVVEIVSVIENIADSDIFEMKLHARKLLELHFSTDTKQIDSVGYVLTKRIGFALPPTKSHRSEQFYPNADVMDYYNFTLPNFQIELDPYLGPSDIPATDSHNVTDAIVKSSISYPTRSYHGDNFRMYPSTPWDPVLPSDAVLRGNWCGLVVGCCSLIGQIVVVCV